MLLDPLPSLFIKYFETVNDLIDFIESLTEKDNYPCQVYDDADGKKFITCRRRFCEDQIESFACGKDTHYSVDSLLAVLSRDGFVFLDFETCEMTIAVLSFSQETVSSGFNMKCLVTQKKYPNLRHSWIFVSRIFSDFFAKV